ncbi:hypothetical protein TL16_g10035 [Triparma laevis f. inornata]|uniref:FHA domain-containing protein n=1 Tax=Triparma laevis f. inornata TaxID=1714386 RepID=A0A9W7B618_9STRA|nr:hypothetical protein TL16_g10035 [Triparma laevis f. inornata]
MSKREHDHSTSNAISSALSSNNKSKKAKYDDVGEFSAKSGDEWGVNKDTGSGANNSDSSTGPKQKANFGLSGALAKDEVTGAVKNGVVLKYSPPAERVKPTAKWRLYVFKGEELLETLHLGRDDYYLFGRDDKVADIHVEHGSLSGQHAVLQFRQVPYSGPKQKFKGKLVCKPYVIDLESTNGTLLNGEKIEGGRYYEAKKGDVMRFGESTREYVMMIEK